jgi:hypothetical protein
MAAFAIIAGIGVFCWLLYSAAIYALPLLVGLTIFFHAEQAGAGTLGAIVLGFGTGVLVLIAGRTVFSLVRRPILRVAVALIFAIPAVVAGYSTTLGLSSLAVPSAGFQHAFAIAGALAVSVTTWLRLAASPPAIASGAHHAPEQPNPQEVDRQTVLPRRRPLRISSRSGARIHTRDA